MKIIPFIIPIVAGIAPEFLIIDSTFIAVLRGIEKKSIIYKSIIGINDIGLTVDYVDMAFHGL